MDADSLTTALGRGWKRAITFSSDQRTRFALLVVVAIIGSALVSATFVGAALTGHQQEGEIEPYHPTDGTRIFVSDDPDIPAETELSDGEPSKGGGSAEKNAESLDFGYTGPDPPMTAENQTLNEFRWNNLRDLERSPDTSLYFPRSDRENHTLIRDHHVTIMGFDQGSSVGYVGREVATTSLIRWIADSGTVFNFADYRILPRTLPDGGCEASYETRGHEHEVEDEDGNTTTVTRTHYIDGQRTCVSYKLGTVIEYRWMDIGEGDSKRTYYNTGHGRRISYNGVPPMEEPTTLRVYHSVNAPIRKVTRKADWDNGRNLHNKQGDWETTSTTDEISEWRNHTATDSRRVLEKSSRVSNMEIKERVVEINDNHKHIILSWEGPRTGDDGQVRFEDLNKRAIWSRIQLTDDKTVRNGWTVYSMRRYGHARGDDPTFAKRALNDTYSHRVQVPQVLWTWVAGSPVAPSVQAPRRGVADSTRVAQYTAYNMTDSGAFLIPEKVNLTAGGRGQVYTNLVIRDASTSIKRIDTVSGESIYPGQWEREQVDYRQPDIELIPNVQRAGYDDTGTLIVVTDPKTGKPLPNRELRIRGAEQATVSTNRNGVAFVTRNQPFLEVTHQRTELLGSYGDVYYGETRVIKTFLRIGDLTQLTLDLVGAAILAAPLILLLVYWRSSDLLKV
jgi:hypothetical protein